jgi:hypothetical protein
MIEVNVFNAPCFEPKIDRPGHENVNIAFLDPVKEAIYSSHVRFLAPSKLMIEEHEN